MQRIIHIIARFSFSFILIFFGLNQFLHFLPHHGFPPEAQALFDAFQNAGYILNAVGFVQILLGITLLFNRYVPLALMLFAPILVNVLLFHLCVDIGGLPKVVPTLLLYSYFVFKYRNLFNIVIKKLAV